MSYSFMKFEVTEGVALCTFDRPDAANAMHLGMMEEMFGIAVRIDEDPAIRAAVFTRLSISVRGILEFSSPNAMFL